MSALKEIQQVVFGGQILRKDNPLTLSEKAQVAGFSITKLFFGSAAALASLLTVEGTVMPDMYRLMGSDLGYSANYMSLLPAASVAVVTSFGLIQSHMRQRRLFERHGLNQAS